MEKLCSVAEDRTSKTSQVSHLIVFKEDNTKPQKEVVNLVALKDNSPGAVRTAAHC